MIRKRACDVCYRRKIQCSIPRPESPCEWCHEHDLSCTFDREAQKKQRKRFKLSDVEGLFSRVEQLENALAATRPDRLASGIEALASPPSDTEDEILQSESSPGPILQPSARESTDSPIPPLAIHARPTNVPFERSPTVDVPLSQYWYSRGIPLLSERGHRYIHLKTSQKLSFEKLRVASCLGNSPLLGFLTEPSSQGRWKLPPRKAIQKFASAFFESPMQRNFPVLDDRLFKETIKTACGYSNGTPSLLEAQSIACVSAALAIFDRAEPLNGKQIEDGDVYATKARGILGYIMTTEPGVVGLETVLLLQRYYMFTANAQGAAQLHAVACRMVCALGGHAYQPVKHTENSYTQIDYQERHLRRLFLLCYLSDKDISLRAGQPPLLTEEFCDLPIPETGLVGPSHQLMRMDDMICSTKDGLTIQGGLSLYRLKEKIHRLLYSPRAFIVSDGELVLRIRQLDDDLEQWRLSIPPDIRPKLSVPPLKSMTSQGLYAAPDVRYTQLQLEYHHLITAIHTAVRRCGGDNPEHSDLPDDIHNVIHSSCDLSLEANRSTLTLLKNHPTILGEQESGDIAFYTTLAVVSLFLDILAHPQNEQSRITLTYLSSGLNIIQSLFTPILTQSELKNIQETCRFIKELIRLGGCALTKAQGTAPKTDEVPC